ncbi:hypothetical protein D3C86_1738380 [compost metagenome]
MLLATPLANVSSVKITVLFDFPTNSSAPFLLSMNPHPNNGSGPTFPASAAECIINVFAEAAFNSLLLNNCLLICVHKPIIPVTTGAEYDVPSPTVKLLLPTVSSAVDALPTEVPTAVISGFIPPSSLGPALL